jgi:hypothetical protein
MASQAIRAVAALLLAASAAHSAPVNERSVLGDIDQVLVPKTPTCLNWLATTARCTQGTVLAGGPQTLYRLSCNPAVPGNCQAICCKTAPATNTNQGAPTTIVRQVQPINQPPTPDTTALESPTPAVPLPPPAEASTPIPEPPMPSHAPVPTTTPPATVTCTYWGTYLCAEGTVPAGWLQDLVLLRCDPTVPGNCQAVCCKPLPPGGFETV